jgi:hypothetical protein
MAATPGSASLRPERARLNVTRAIEPDARLPIPQLGSWVLSSGS